MRHYIVVLPTPPPAAKESLMDSLIRIADTPLFIGLLCGGGAVIVSLCCLLICVCRSRYRRNRTAVTSGAYSAHENDAYAEHADKDSSYIDSSGAASHTAVGHTKHQTGECARARERATVHRAVTEDAAATAGNPDENEEMDVDKEVEEGEVTVDAGGGALKQGGGAAMETEGAGDGALELGGGAAVKDVGAGGVVPEHGGGAAKEAEGVGGDMSKQGGGTAKEAEGVGGAVGDNAHKAATEEVLVTEGFY